MGFSVSGAAAIIFASLFIAFGAFYTATADSFERTTEAEGAYAEDVRELRNTRINITEIKDGEPISGVNEDMVRIRVTNTGASQIELSKTDLLVNGSYVDGWHDSGNNADVDGDTTTNLWLPGETLSVTLDIDGDNVNRVKVVAKKGIADARTKVIT
jgi:flagellar protein FlaF